MEEWELTKHGTVRVLLLGARPRTEMLAERLLLPLKRTPTTVGGEPCENLRRRSGENS